MLHVETSQGPGSAAGVSAAGATSTTVQSPVRVLLIALALGFAIELLLHGQPFGLGYVLAAIVAAAGWLLLGRVLRLPASHSALGLLGVFVLLSVPVGLRSSGTLRALDVLAGLGLLLLIAALYLPGSLHRLSLTDYVLTAITAAFAAAFAPFWLLLSDLPRAPRHRVTARRSTVLWPAVRGVLLALPLLLLFGALFYAADAVFAGYARQFLYIDLNLEEVILRLFLSLCLSWCAAGLARYAFARPRVAAHPVSFERPAGLVIGKAELLVILGLLDLLFLAFAGIQAVYLFGGADTLASTGLTHSEYARRGFFELVTVAALVLSLVLALDWLVRSGEAGDATPRGPGWLWARGLYGVLVALTLVVLVSALQRMNLYQATYGLTELRLYTTAFMAWLAVVLVWLVLTVLAGYPTARQRFAFGAFVTALALLAGLNLLNPDALIARTNLARAAAGVGEPLDSQYIVSGLSADAIPTTIAALPSVADPCQRAELARQLLDRRTNLAREAERIDWRGANLARARALSALAAQSSALEAAERGCASR